MFSQAATEIILEQEAVSVLSALEDAAIRPLIFKGTPLAYSYYPEPFLRPRCDTDMLVLDSQLARTKDVLLQLGYRPGESAARDISAYELAYYRTDASGIGHCIDLHWRLNNSQILARLFSYDELYAASVAVDKLSPAAHMPCPTHALLIGCVHRAAHLKEQYNTGSETISQGNRLIWLYDLHLLSNLLTDADWTQFLELAQRRQVRALCLDALHTTQQRFNTPLPAAVMAALAANGPPELSAHLLRSSRWRSSLADLRALPGWKQRVRLIGEWVFPPSNYMLRKYKTRNKHTLPLLYLRRLAGGIAKATQPTAAKTKK